MGQAMSYPAFCTRLIDLEGAGGTLASAQAWLDVLHRQDVVPPLRQGGLSAWLEDTRLICRSTGTHSPLEPSEAESLRILARYAPLGLLAGCVLQNFAQPANCHLPLAAHAHAAHALLVGSGQTAAIWPCCFASAWSRLVCSCHRSVPRSIRITGKCRSTPGACPLIA